MVFLIFCLALFTSFPDRAYEGAKFHDEGNFDKAIESYSKALEELPGNFTLTYNLACAYYENGEPHKAALLFDSLLAKPDTVLKGYQSDIFYNSGTSYLRSVQKDSDSIPSLLDSAIIRLTKSLVLNPLDSECRRNLEIALRMKNNRQSQQDQQD
ncbi:tetratricopeptide repeat protein, partial [candidate division WOR-3 bacterium]|nr:tetratricopeptide repeat protein [candidate division WOR-3 bacterium]